MPKKKKSKKEEREEARKARIQAIKEKNNLKQDNSLITNVNSEVTSQDLKKVAMVVGEKSYLKTELLKADGVIIKSEKTAIQRELESITLPPILEMPDFLTNPDKEEIRKSVMEKVKYLLKCRFSLIEIADILECNNYDRLDELIELKERIIQLLEKYNTQEVHETDQEDSQESQPKITIFSNFKKVVGQEYSSVYYKQENDRMGKAISILYDGTYFENAKKARVPVETYVEDIVAEVINHPEFNLACQIENEFISYEIDRVDKIISELTLRSELQDLLDELRNLSITVTERSNAYNLMDMLINGKKEKREIIKKSEDQEVER